MIGGGHFFVQALVDILRLPVVHIKILDHLEVGDSHAARVAEEVGDDMDAVLVEDLIGLGEGNIVIKIIRLREGMPFGREGAGVENEKGPIRSFVGSGP